MYKVKLLLVESQYDGYISREPGSEITRHNTWNGWESPVWMNREQLEAFIKGQQEYKREGGCIDDWSMEGETVVIKEFECSEGKYEIMPNLIDGVKYWDVSFGYVWELADD
jgi:hypothetical protein